MLQSYSYNRNHYINAFRIETSVTVLSLWVKEILMPIGNLDTASYILTREIIA